MSKETFKLFARNHPELASHVLKEEVTWQRLYELYEIYGEDSKVWDGYIVRSLPSQIEQGQNTFKDLVGVIKNIDLGSVQKGVNNLQKTIGLLQDIGIGGTNRKKDTYEPRPLYKYFED